MALGACYTGEGISCKIEAVEASEDLVTGGPTHHMQDVIKLARTFAINFLKLQEPSNEFFANDKYMIKI